MLLFWASVSVWKVCLTFTMTCCPLEHLFISQGNCGASENVSLHTLYIRHTSSEIFQIFFSPPTWWSSCKLMKIRNPVFPTIFLLKSLFTSTQFFVWTPLPRTAALVHRGSAEVLLKPRWLWPCSLQGSGQELVGQWNTIRCSTFGSSSGTGGRC